MEEDFFPEEEFDYDYQVSLKKITQNSSLTTIYFAWAAGECTTLKNRLTTIYFAWAAGGWTGSDEEPLEKVDLEVDPACS